MVLDKRLLREGVSDDGERKLFGEDWSDDQKSSSPAVTIKKEDLSLNDWSKDFVVNEKEIIHVEAVDDGSFGAKKQGDLGEEDKRRIAAIQKMVKEKAEAEQKVAEEVQKKKSLISRIFGKK